MLERKTEKYLKQALVLGGKGDIGAAISMELAAICDKVTAVGSEDFDLGDRDQIDRFFLQSGNEYDVLIHCAGFNVPKEFSSLNIDEIQRSIDVNLNGFLHVASKCLPYWQKRRGAHILVISSLYATFGRRGRLPYVMSKHALNGVVKTLAIELAEFGVLVNALSPGYIATKMTFANNNEEILEKLTRGIPLRRLGRPDEIAKLARFLCSSQNSYLTGQNITVDGGFSAGGFQ